eukprot:COSAG01_NODE_952_length_12499_cov_84.157661_7_plen_33_part_00
MEKKALATQQQTDIIVLREHQKRERNTRSPQP